MTEPTTYYRIDESLIDGDYGLDLHLLKKGGVLVPVVPCEHGNIDPHNPEHATCYECPGAAVGEETP